MKKQIHREITILALGGYFGVDALETVIIANLGQDALRYQFGHDHFHYDSNSFTAGDAYCEQLRLVIAAALRNGQSQQARKALGRLTHTLQDLYAHSNYVSLWRQKYPDSSPDDIDPELVIIRQDSGFHSGKLYYPLEILSFIDPLKKYVLPLLPRDSHAWMNLDDPTRPGFDYAFSAAVKRTGIEYLRIIEKLPSREVTYLTGAAQ
ncbi:MAG: hypothetical protein NT121_10690 [Chloroflexi bacterium]|nr:hypothetical protein [Chloroflexota bacterium]